MNMVISHGILSCHNNNIPLQILVYAESDEALEFAKTQIPVVMGRTVSGP